MREQKTIVVNGGKRVDYYLTSDQIWNIKKKTVEPVSLAQVDVGTDNL